ncbi:unnamed protein product, partial [Anisakis simplex]|uniref:Uncharacterized protein n=1 Tax=Anisakis simplex TaxID=6269 RepID=A0A0M3KK17_ANISI
MVSTTFGCFGGKQQTCCHRSRRQECVQIPVCIQQQQAGCGQYNSYQQPYVIGGYEQGGGNGCQQYAVPPHIAPALPIDTSPFVGNSQFELQSNTQLSQPGFSPSSLGQLVAPVPFPSNLDNFESIESLPAPLSSQIDTNMLSSNANNPSMMYSNEESTQIGAEGGVVSPLQPFRDSHIDLQLRHSPYDSNSIVNHGANGASRETFKSFLSPSDRNAIQ